MILGSWKQGFNSLITLGEWIVWKHCNNIVLNGAKPSVELILRQILEAVTSGKLEAGFELGGHSDPGKLEAGFELTDHSGCMNRVEALQQ